MSSLDQVSQSVPSADGLVSCQTAPGADSDGRDQNVNHSSTNGPSDDWNNQKDDYWGQDIKDTITGDGSTRGQLENPTGGMDDRNTCPECGFKSDTDHSCVNQLLTVISDLKFKNEKLDSINHQLETKMRKQELALRFREDEVRRLNMAVGAKNDKLHEAERKLTDVHKNLQRNQFNDSEREKDEMIQYIHEKVQDLYLFSSAATTKILRQFNNHSFPAGGESQSHPTSAISRPRRPGGRFVPLLPSHRLSTTAQTCLIRIPVSPGGPGILRSSNPTTIERHESNLNQFIDLNNCSLLKTVS